MAFALAVTVGAPAAVAAAEVRLIDPSALPTRTAGPVTAIDDAAGLLDPLVPAGDPRRADIARALRTAGFVGGLSRSHTGPGRPGITSFAVRLGSAGDARGARDAVLRALAARAGTRLTASAIAGVPGGRMAMTATSTGMPAITALLPVGAWLHGIEALPGAGGAPPDASEVTALAQHVLARSPDGPNGVPPAAEPLVVTAAMEGELASARAARGLRRAGPAPAPRAGSVQAARLDGDEFALASFPGAGEPDLFRRRPGGAWRHLGDVGGPGCPRIPVPVREVWGLAATCPAVTSVVAAAGGAGLEADASPLHGIGMWVWEVPRSGGTPGIIDRARRFGLRTIHVKSGDGIHYWRQFDAALPALRAAGLRVCGWQYVRGRSPRAEARIAARAIRRGADCFIVNAEAEFERMGIGRTSRAQRVARAYMAELRRQAGHRVPIGFTSYAYVHYHARFPYSAFLTGPDAADVNMPQVYWGAFGVPVEAAMRRTAEWNALYGVPIAPIGGTYEREPADELRRFRCLAAGYGWAGVSYWSLQHTRRGQWAALSNTPACEAPPSAPREYPELRPGRAGDHVLRLQDRLRAWGYPVAGDGRYGPATRAAVAAFQRDRGARATGVTTPLTWALLLEAEPGA